MRGKRAPDCNINLGLAIFETEEWQAKRRRWKHRLKLSAIPTFDELAALCGCRRAAMQLIVFKALRKSRKRLVEKMSETEIRETLTAMSQATGRKQYEYPKH